jgi:hypothetical protein
VPRIQESREPMIGRELRATVSPAAIFAIRPIGLFMIYPVFCAHERELPGGSPLMIGMISGPTG